MGAADSWRTHVERKFSFLTERGFVHHSDSHSFWETASIWALGSVAIKVAKSTEFQRVDVQLIRLVDGDVPAYPVWITAEPVHWVLMDNVLQARAPQRFADIPTNGLAKRDIDAQLEFWAEAIVDVVPDFLGGDAACIDEAAAILRAKVSEHPQRLTISLPEEASDEQVDAAVAEARRGLPEEVEVVVMRYRRPT